MLVRKVIYKEYFHHQNGSTYDNNPGATSPLVASTANNWTQTYNVTTGGYITPVAAIPNDYLTNYTAFSIGSQMTFEYSMVCQSQVGTDTTSGMAGLFMLDNDATSFTAGYRIRQTQPTLHVEQFDGLGAWTPIGSFSAPTDHQTQYHYRVHFAPFGHKVYGVSTAFTAGQMHIYRGTSQHIQSFIGSLTAPAHLTSGGYMGVWHGPTKDVDFYYMSANRFWECDVEHVSTKHEISNTSAAEVTYPRYTESLQTKWGINNRAEIWAPETVGSSDALRLYFDGRVEMDPQSARKGQVLLLGWTSELEYMPWFEATTQTGAISDVISTVLNEDGGVFATVGSPSSALTYVLHKNNVETIATTTNRNVRGTSAMQEIKALCSEVGGWFFFMPDGRFPVKTTLLDSSTTISSLVTTDNIVDVEYIYDGTQIKNEYDNYHTGYLTPANAIDYTSKNAYGARGGTIVDMKVQSSTVAQNVINASKTGFSGNPRMVKLTCALRHFNIFPGMKVLVKLAGSDLGTNNYDTDTNNWVAKAMTCTQTTYDSDTGEHVLYLVENTSGADDTPVRRRFANGSPGNLIGRVQSQVV